MACQSGINLFSFLHSMSLTPCKTLSLLFLPCMQLAHFRIPLLLLLLSMWLIYHKILFCWSYFACRSHIRKSRFCCIYITSASHFNEFASVVFTLHVALPCGKSLCHFYIECDLQFSVFSFFYHARGIFCCFKIAYGLHITHPNFADFTLLSAILKES